MLIGVDKGSYRKGEDDLGGNDGLGFQPNDNW